MGRTGYSIQRARSLGEQLAAVLGPDGERHHPKCRRRYARPHNHRARPDVERITALVGEFIDWIATLGEIAPAAEALRCVRPAPGARGSCGCIRCDLAKIEAIEAQLRGGYYDVPECCAEYVMPLMSTRRHLNAVAERWDLAAPFPADKNETATQAVG